MVPFALDTAARVIVVVALVYASVVALTHWAVRRRKIGPFGPWPRLVRRLSDPVLLPLERRVIRFGGSPQDAPLWLLGIVIVGGLVLVSVTNWILAMTGTLGPWPMPPPRLDPPGRSWAFTSSWLAIFVRVIASWFGVSEFRAWMRPLVLLSDWIIRPTRRMLPASGMIDFSPMVAWLILWVARGFVLGLL